MVVNKNNGNNSQTIYTYICFMLQQMLIITNNIINIYLYTTTQINSYYNITIVYVHV